MFKHCVRVMCSYGEMTINTRPWDSDDVPYLWRALYLSLHVRDGGEPFALTVVDEPQIAHHLTGFGRAGDDAQVAITNTGAETIGAAWCRRMSASDPGYGFVAEDVPELGMAIEPAFRGQGIGRRLLLELLARNPAMSLSVDQQNKSAAALYTTLGFRVVAEDETSLTMLRSR
jgi:ribosomal protein S18 acetylase RimI-like enzyme